MAVLSEDEVRDFVLWYYTPHALAFGGMTVGGKWADKWGYPRCATPQEFAERYRRHPGQVVTRR